MQEWLHAARDEDPFQRPSFSSLVSSQSVLSQHPFVSIATFLEDFQTRSFSEKEQFFKGLYSQCSKLSPEIIRSRILPKMLASNFFLEPTAISFLPIL